VRCRIAAFPLAGESRSNLGVEALLRGHGGILGGLAVRKSRGFQLREFALRLGPALVRSLGCVRRIGIGIELLNIVLQFGTYTGEVLLSKKMKEFGISVVA
jgi:hypothetical protein